MDFRLSNITHLALTISIDSTNICDSFKYLSITITKKTKWLKHFATVFLPICTKIILPQTTKPIV